jgi:hypothetical protein
VPCRPRHGAPKPRQSQEQPRPVAGLSVFSALVNKGSTRSRDSIFEVVSRTIEHKSLSWFLPLCGGNSATSSRLISRKIGTTRGEQSARMVYVLKGVWISCLLPKGLGSFYRQS